MNWYASSSIVIASLPLIFSTNSMRVLICSWLSSKAVVISRTSFPRSTNFTASVIPFAKFAEAWPSSSVASLIPAASAPAKIILTGFDSNKILATSDAALSATSIPKMVFVTSNIPFISSFNFFSIFPYESLNSSSLVVMKAWSASAIPSSNLATPLKYSEIPLTSARRFSSSRSMALSNSKCLIALFFNSIILALSVFLYGLISRVSPTLSLSFFILLRSRYCG